MIRVLSFCSLCSSNPLDELVNRLAPKMSGRMMKYPYTFTAKIAQFPLQYYVKNVWLIKYYALGVGVTIPIFAWIQKLCKLLTCILIDLLPHDCKDSIT